MYQGFAPQMEGASCCVREGESERASDRDVKIQDTRKQNCHGALFDCSYVASWHVLPLVTGFLLSIDSIPEIHSILCTRQKNRSPFVSAFDNLEDSPAPIPWKC